MIIQGRRHNLNVKVLELPKNRQNPSTVNIANFSQNVSRLIKARNNDKGGDVLLVNVGH